MAVITDWGHETDIHVKQKRPVGERLALVARALVYGEKILYSGPLSSKPRFGVSEIVTHFHHVDTGLTCQAAGVGRCRAGSQDRPARGRLARGGRRIRRHQCAVARLYRRRRGQKVLSGPGRNSRPAGRRCRARRWPSPVAVRYGWADYPTGNLFNREGLPASPFRSDDCG